jgi:hypothetical protein
MVRRAGRTRTHSADLLARSGTSTVAMSVSEVFHRITSALGEAGIAYMLAGSFASAYYGPPRTTQDIDLVIAATADQLRKLVQLLSKDQYSVDLDTALEARNHQSLFNAVDMATGWKIDLIIRKSRPFSNEEFRRRKLVNVQGRSLFVASAEDVVVSKLERAKLTQSQRHIEDVAGILRMRWDSLDRAYLEKWILELRIEAEWNDARRAAGVSD